MGEYNKVILLGNLTGDPTFAIRRRECRFVSFRSRSIIVTD
jgi:hypothetical protein